MGAQDRMSSLRWNPFAGLQQQRAADHEDTDAQGHLSDVEPDPDQGQRTTEPPKPPDMNALIRRAVGVNTRPGHEKPPPQIGD
jgi:hypothetical protein